MLVIGVCEVVIRERIHRCLSAPPNQRDFADVIAQAIAAHHGTDDPNVHELSPVNVAVLIPEVDETRAVGVLTERAQEVLGIDPADTRQIVEESFCHAEEIAEQFA